MRRRHRWLTLTAAAALTLSACADDAPDEASSATDPDLASGSAADDPDVAEQLAAEAEELGIELSDEELADAAIALGLAAALAVVLVVEGTIWGRGVIQETFQGPWGLSLFGWLG